VKTDAGLLVESYLSWIRNTVTAEVLENGATELTTPFLDRYNDHLQIYAERRSPDIILLTDDGYILAELKSSGVEKRGQHRAELFAQLLSGYGVSVSGNELQVEATEHDLGRCVHNLVQAMLSLDDMFVLAQPRVEPIFVEDVAKFLDDHEVRYSPRVKFAGKSGLDHLVDFVIPKSRQAPERMLKVVNAPRRDRVESLLFAANDMRAVRGKDVQYVAIVNDTRREVSPEVLNALRAYEVIAQPWSHRGQFVGQLVA
jgi:Domain of unknown function DUF1828/Domain of unknown function DUF1829